MQMKKFFLMRLRALKSRQRYWNGAQQQLFIGLRGKRGLRSVRCCPKCPEEVAGNGPNHGYGEAVIEVQIKEPKKVSGGHVSAWS